MSEQVNKNKLKEKGVHIWSNYYLCDEVLCFALVVY